jgi:hypothetical protein
MKQVAKQKKVQHGWVLDEYSVSWEVDGKKQRVYYHKDYPEGLLADGSAAPPISCVAAAGD